MSLENENTSKKEIALTPKQRMWLQAYGDIDNPTTLGNATRSALVAYYPNFPIDKDMKDLTDQEKLDYECAKAMGSENLSKLNIPVSQLMNEMGLTDTKLLSKLGELLSCEKPYGKSAILHADNTARAKALEIGLKLKKLLSDRPEVNLKGLFFSDKMQLEIIDSENKEENEVEDEEVE